MKQSINFLILTIIIYSLITHQSKASQDTIQGHGKICFGNLTTTNMILYENFTNNVYSLLSILSSNPSSSFFYNTSITKYPPTVYGSYFCRADLKPKQCTNCISDTAKFLSDPQFSITNSDCYGYGSYRDSIHCIIHFSNTSTFSVYQPGRILYSESIGEKVVDYKTYNETLFDTIEGLVEEARLGNWSIPNFETRIVKIDGSDEKIYALVECTPDISAMNCSRCLKELNSEIPRCCNGTQGGYIAHGNCLMKYNNESFFGTAHHAFMPNFWHFSMGLITTTMYFLFV
ncbi:unnamed protein product [Amaranthus hypochondriacus]